MPPHKPCLPGTTIFEKQTQRPHGAGPDRARECPALFFSSRRRHTRYIGDWSSDVCSSDLTQRSRLPRRNGAEWAATTPEPRSESVVEGKRVDLGGRRIIKKNRHELYPA